MRLWVSALLALALGATSSVARADLKHVVARGNTIGEIALRYHVSEEAIIRANHIDNPKHIQPGDVLVIPGVSAKGKRRSKARSGGKTGRVAKVGRAPARKTTSYAKRARRPNVVHLHRLATDESYTIRIKDSQGRITKSARARFKKMMRSPSGARHSIHPRLIRLLGIVSNHFGGRKIEVISGYRPGAGYNAHSKHRRGRAIDFRVTGVPNEVVRDFCRTLKNVGCGYYPNSVFVHMDTRDRSAYWIDYSRPGQPPQYSKPSDEADAEESTAEVTDEVHPATGATPTDPAVETESDDDEADDAEPGETLPPLPRF